MRLNGLGRNKHPYPTRPLGQLMKNAALGRYACTWSYPCPNEQAMAVIVHLVLISVMSSSFAFLSNRLFLPLV